MNRRNFFKVVTGFVAGIFATSVEGKKRSGTRYVSPSSSPTSTTTTSSTSTPSNCIYICNVSDLNDDTKAIQEAINLAKKGGVVYFPKGTYNLKYGIIV